LHAPANPESATFRESVRLFRRLLAECQDVTRVRTLRRLLAAAERQLAIADAEKLGVELRPASTIGTALTARRLDELRISLETSHHPYVIIDPGPGLRIVDFDVAPSATLHRRVAGERLFDVFPDNPDQPTADGVANVFASLQRAAGTGLPQPLGIQRYDLRSATGPFVEKYWKVWSTPILDEQGKLMFLVLQADERHTFAVFEASGQSSTRDEIETPGAAGQLTRDEAATGRYALMRHRIAGTLRA
jgi:hypothetical protein